MYGESDFSIKKNALVFNVSKFGSANGLAHLQNLGMMNIGQWRVRWGESRHWKEVRVLCEETEEWRPPGLDVDLIIGYPEKVKTRDHGKVPEPEKLLPGLTFIISTHGSDNSDFRKHSKGKTKLLVYQGLEAAEDLLEEIGVGTNKRKDEVQAGQDSSRTNSSDHALVGYNEGAHTVVGAGSVEPLGDDPTSTVALVLKEAFSGI
ncbi:hypothetical protein B0H16DRAFT_1462277 [Mycena metata]|uniref:Uncharacterized protein n=1 Tax=Mycena metata TaxID=1033252 RepID=A0AAD7IR27_9AGAR|nr:hypothetical protein B0H16DRAFT_1462277 [Mycena metata]